MSTEPRSEASISLRPVDSDDREFLFKVYASTRADEMLLVPWTDEQKESFVRSQFNAQLLHYEKAYPTGSHDVILVNGKPAGRLYVARLANEIRIIDITVLPEERNAGIGSHLLRQLMEESKSASKITRIYVEEFNRSLALFKRLGFLVGEKQDFNLLMEWKPSETDPT